MAQARCGGMCLNYSERYLIHINKPSAYQEDESQINKIISN
ncbi:hypothetical protein P262_04050 [Cronobacter malonaticus]|uniref:Uncharacterized protein n=1 Tax=Cronobacter malonaticus TaxID=413503 RepID=V5U2L9_9ENTR|nr:hypothetical protein P262_04050 [Cronobacter malonaticus]CCJ95829.1 hypothetical protein BN131_3502 [Cronobacter malonaticus 681]